MKKLLAIAAASIVLSTSAFAATETVDNTSHFSTETYSNRAEAVNAGFNLIDNLNSMSDNELRKALSLYSEAWVGDITIADSQVTISEFAHNRGELNYRANVDVDYSYLAMKNDN